MAPPLTLGLMVTSLTKSKVTLLWRCWTTNMDLVRFRAWSCSGFCSSSTSVPMRKTLARWSTQSGAMSGTLYTLP